jgi:hypothetical protein
MTRPKLGLLCLCSLVASVMAISTSSAQAAGSWLVGTTQITGTGFSVNLLAAVGGEIEGTSGTLLTHLLNLRVAVTCTTLFSMTNMVLQGEGKLFEGAKVTFTGCTVTQGDITCLVKSPGAALGTIETNELKGELVLHTGGVVLVKIEPKSATAGFVTLHFEGEECLLPLLNKISGVLFLKDCENKAETFAVKHLIEQGPLTSLTVGADTAEHLETSIDGSAWVSLGGAHTGQEWRAMSV